MLKVKVDFKLGRRLAHALSTTMVSYKGLCSWVIARGGWGNTVSAALGGNATCFVVIAKQQIALQWLWAAMKDERQDGLCQTKKNCSAACSPSPTTTSTPDHFSTRPARSSSPFSSHSCISKISWVYLSLSVSADCVDHDSIINVWLGAKSKSTGTESVGLSSRTLDCISDFLSSAFFICFSCF